ncbi:MAG: trigger factor [Alphaproteobacteria bacterium]|nr:trigger factor [Alphaproteobacteria bacterium]
MQVTETSSEGLKRAYRVVVPSGDIQSSVDEKINALAATARLPGFRPGKVPSKVLRQRFGKSVLGEVLQETLDSSVRKMIEEKSLRPALQPKVEVTKFDEGNDLEYSIEVEVLPDITPGDFSALKLERVVAEPAEADVEEGLKRLADQQKTYNPTEAAAAAREGDAVIVDYDGAIDGETFVGGSGKDVQVVLGAGWLVPGFEAQLVGAKAGDQKEVVVTFPADYPYEQLRGKEAKFAVAVKEVKVAAVPPLDDELAKRLGIDNLKALRQRVHDQLAQEFTQISRARLKRQLLDQLDAANRFEVPGGLVDGEFQAIWQQVETDRQRGVVDEDQKGKPDDELKAEYRAIAERRVRLGLLLSKVGEANNISVAQDEVNRAITQQSQRFPGQEQRIFEYYRSNPQAAAQLRAPIFEDKVVDFLIELAAVTERKVSKEELTADPEAKDRS